MLFDDLFYPDNPQKRLRVTLLHGEIVATFKSLQDAWNTNAKLLNGIFLTQAAPYNIQLDLMTFDIEKEEVNNCIKNINDTLQATKKTMKKLISDIGLDNVLPADWSEKGFKYDPNNPSSALEISKIISISLSSVLSAYITFYISTGVSVAIAVISTIVGVQAGILGYLAGALGGLICGSVAFVITDIISSAITGAIQRGKLNEAIDALEGFKAQVLFPLQSATAKIAGITQNIKDSNYMLDSTHLLIKLPNGSYAIIDISTIQSNTQIRRATASLCAADNAEDVPTVDQNIVSYIENNWETMEFVVFLPNIVTR